ncbi:AbrB family transcriptional regulator [Speluncibacter jeojiensis]|uniref:AbrB family transcriptional regulator n=1 Tax=Speluncibacter jeojiensis TaxID=2710754 RepID=A0A9X4LYS2_9ACTN|nr:AbrB family transcriptional regulator [Corynebacteriales bacterium D3-21]
MVHASAWAGLVAGCYALAEQGERWGVPAPQLVGSLVVGAVLAVGGVVHGVFPHRAWLPAQALVGVLMGSYLSSAALASVAPTALPLSAATLLTIAICVGIAALLARSPRVSLAAATLGLAPGGSAAIISLATDQGTDSRLVAFSQYLRVGLVALSAPLVVAVIGGGGNGIPAAELGRRSAGGLGRIASGPWMPVLLAAICVVGAVAGRRLRLPSAVLLGPLLLAMAVTLAGVHGFAPAGALRDVALVVIGLEVGLRFTRATIGHLGRLLPEVLACICAVCVLCAGIAWALGRLIGIPFVDAYLATTPGGINAVLATAASTGTDVPLVSTVQSLRLVVVVLAVPLLLRWLAHRQSMRESRRAAVEPAPVEDAA